MSVFDGLGAAAAIIQFIGVGIKLSNKAIAVYKDKDRQEFASLKQQTNDFQTSTKVLVDNLHIRSTGPDSGEAMLMRIAEDCQQHAAELVQLIDSVQMKPEEKSIWNALKMTTKSEMKTKEIVAKRKELKQARHRCQEQLSLMLSDRNYALAETLDRIENRQAQSDSAMSRRLAELRKDLIAAIRSSDGVAVVEKAMATQKLVTLDLPQENILSSLVFSDINNRQDRIEDPSHSTYEWIFDRKKTASAGVQYLPWLDKGNGIFWITGKAGSGKSTLMKYIRNDPRTLECLQSWSNGRKLFVASHYFWHLGSPMERSFSGLLKSILYEVLQSCPDLIEPVCKARWNNELRGRDASSVAWTDAELRQCLETLTTSDLKFKKQKICFCFFIDGLDEFDGDYEVVDALVRLASNSGIKICASSRPWNKFEVAFDVSKQRGRYLELHLHTKGDVANFVKGELRDTLTRVGKAHSDLDSVVSEVIDRSEGVFLWVSLVIRNELRPLLEARESIDALKERINTIPMDLNDYYHTIFERMWADTKYRRDTARIFKSCMAASQPLPVDAMKAMIDDSPNQVAVTSVVEREYEWNGEEKIKTARAQVNGRCQDLLSVVAPSGSSARLGRQYHRIEFLHRSVRDFVDQSSKVSQELERHAGPGFDADLTLLACYVFLLTKAFSLVKTDSLAREQEVPVWVQWCTEGLLHMRKASQITSTADMLRVLDHSMQFISSGPDETHWSNEVCHSQRLPGPNFAERRSRDLAGHLIEFGLIDHVMEILTSNPDMLGAKQGRPYLDYALRFDEYALFRKETTPAIFWSDISTDAEMVKALLSKGCDVNESVFIYDGRTVWDLYLAFLYDNYLSGERYRQITWLLIEHGARPIKSCAVGRKQQRMTAKYHEVVVYQMELTMDQILSRAFGKDKATAMCKAIANNGRAGGWWFWPF